MGSVVSGGILEGAVFCQKGPTLRLGKPKRAHACFIVHHEQVIDFPKGPRCLSLALCSASFSSAHQHTSPAVGSRVADGPEKVLAEADFEAARPLGCRERRPIEPCGSGDGRRGRSGKDAPLERGVEGAREAVAVESAVGEEKISVVVGLAAEEAGNDLRRRDAAVEREDERLREGYRSVERPRVPHDSRKCACGTTQVAVVAVSFS